MDINRLAAFEALLDIETREAYSNIAVGNAVAEYRPGNEAFVRNLVYGVLENQIYLDWQLDAFVKSGMKKVKPRARVLLRMGAYQADFMNKVPSYAAVSETVNIARKKCPGLSRFINGVLRSYTRAGKKRALPDSEGDPLSFLSVKYSYNRDIAELWLEKFGPDRAASVMEAGNAVPYLTICVNTLKITRSELADMLVKKGFELEEPDVSQMPEAEAAAVEAHALYVKGSGLIETDEFDRGLFYVQDLSSMRAVAALAACAFHSQNEGGSPAAADVCSAPGGKSFFMSMLMNDRLEIMSQDIHSHKIDLISRNGKRLGIKGITAQKGDASVHVPELEDRFDAVMADVPCSGLGVVRRRPEIKLKMTRRKIREISDIQKKILENAASYVRPDGYIMYSTCTISDRENEGITGAFLRKNKSFKKIYERLILPDTDRSDGFYFCIMKRIAR